MGQWECESWTVCAMPRYTTLSIMNTNDWIVITSRWKAVHRKDNGHWPHQGSIAIRMNRISPANMLPKSRKDSDSGLDTVSTRFITTLNGASTILTGRFGPSKGWV